MSQPVVPTLQGLLPELVRPMTLEPPLPSASVPTNFEEVLPLSMIRAHTKTDDVPSVTDRQLELYRSAAFEAAQQYTGFLLTETRTVIEDASARKAKKYRSHIKHRLQWPVADGIVYLYGGTRGQGNQTINVEPGTRTIRIPIVTIALDLAFCCDPGRSDREENYGMKIMYRAGYDCKTLPAGIIAGALKFIAWMVTNPGDEIMTVRNRQAKSDTGIVGSNNVALSSGALEMWRQYDNEAI